MADEKSELYKAKVREMRESDEFHKVQENIKAAKIAEKVHHQIAVDKETIAKENIITDEHGKETSLKTMAISVADRMSNQEMRAYDDMRAAVMDMMRMFAYLNKAINHETKVRWVNSNLKQKLEMVSEWFREYCFDDIKKALPNLVYEVSFDAQNRVAFSLKQEDGSELPQDQIENQYMNSRFNEAMQFGLEANKYQKQEDGSYVHQDTNKVLDKDGFDAIKGNLETVLNDVVSERFTMHFSEKPQPGHKLGLG